jgi:site-specific DNA-methyltransferase (adenine-specific)
VTPYYETESVKLYLGDSLEIACSYDLLVTDPPYGQEFVSGRANGKWGMLQGDDDANGVEGRLATALKGLKRGRHVYIFSGRLDLSALPLCGITELIWDKGTIGMGDLSSPWGPQHEKIVFATYELSKANREKGYGNLSARLRKGSVLRNMRPISGGVKHRPTEKPIDILRQLIESSSVMGETVYDPFAGSGSTLVAAVLEGRKAIGVEIDERYCETAAKRLSAMASRPGDLFSDAASGATEAA